MKILVINAGSSSIKYQLIDMDNEKLIAKGQCDRIGIEGGNFKQKVEGRADYVLDVQMANHAEAVRIVLDTLTSKENGVIASLDEISAVGHRVLHGGEKFSGSVIIDEKVIETIEECCELGPLHNPANLTGIRACEQLMPGVPQVAVFDTGFHQTMPDYAYLYALPYEYYEKYKIRRYGFHGTSHRYVSMRAADMLGKADDPTGLRIVTCHLGNGSSLAAVKDGKCYDTSMGLSPLEGLVMGTRSGDCDPALPFYVMKKTGMSAAEMDAALNKKSGLMGITGNLIDRRDVQSAAEKGDKKAKLAQDMECYRMAKYFGAYLAAIGPIDAIVFTAGVGEFSDVIRGQVCAGLEHLGIKIDPAKNNLAHTRNTELCISADDSKIKIFVIPTDEELVMTEDAYALMAGTYDVHTNFTYSFQSPDYVNKAREAGLQKDLAKNPDLAKIIAKPQSC